MRSRSRESASRTGSGSESYRGGAQDPGNREVEPVRFQPRRLAGVGDDGDRGSPADVAGLHPAARHELADGAELAREPAIPARRGARLDPMIALRAE